MNEMRDEMDYSLTVQKGSRGRTIITIIITIYTGRDQFSPPSIDRFKNIHSSSNDTLYSGH